jgi:hypothetical protein
LTEEPDECESLAIGSEPAAGWAIVPPTVAVSGLFRRSLKITREDSMLKFILSLLALSWNLVWDLLALYWHWVVNNPARGLLVSGVVAVVFGIVSEVTGRASKRPILGTYKTGRKEVVEEFGSKYIQDEIRVSSLD